MPLVRGVRLRVRDVSAPSTLHEREYLDPRAPGAPVPVPAVRLMTTAELHAPPGAPRVLTDEAAALIDTGAWCSIIADGTWQEYERAGLLERLAHPDPTIGTGPCGWIAIGGGRSPFSWGRVWVRLLDDTLDALDPGYLPEQPLPVVARLLHPKPPDDQLAAPNTGPAARLPIPVLFGMNLGILNGTRLRCESVLRSADPHPAFDYGTAIGQQWFLQSP